MAPLGLPQWHQNPWRGWTRGTDTAEPWRVALLSRPKRTHDGSPWACMAQSCSRGSMEGSGFSGGSHGSELLGLWENLVRPSSLLGVVGAERQPGWKSQPGSFRAGTWHPGARAHSAGISQEQGELARSSTQHSTWHVLPACVSRSRVAVSLLTRTWTWDSSPPGLTFTGTESRAKGWSVRTLGFIL